MSAIKNTLQYRPIPEIASADDIESHLRQIVEGGIPGFIIRASSHPDTTAEITRIMTDISGQEHHVGFSLPDTAAFAWRTDVGIGRLHDDAKTSPKQSIITNEPVEGRAAFSLLEAGEDYIAGNLELQKKAGEHLEDGTFDPRLMSGVVYQGEVGQGDKVVFASKNAKGPILHRVDTLEGPRVSKGDVIRSKQASA